MSMAAKKPRRRTPPKDPAFVRERRLLDEGGRNSTSIRSPWGSTDGVEGRETYYSGGYSDNLLQWKGLVGRFWSEMLKDIEEPSLRTALSKRLESFLTCGKAVSVRRCGGCQTDREGSGTFRGTRTCKTRACPVCSKLRSERYSEWVESAWSLMEARPGYAWRWLTLTTKYDPYSKEDASWQSLRTRARACAKAAEKVWTKLLKGKGGELSTGAIRTIEVARRGMVHVNLVYFGPALDIEEVEALISKVSPHMGHAHFQKVNRKPAPPELSSDGRKKKRPKGDEEFELDESDERGSLEGLKRVAKYISKGLDHETSSMKMRDEDWVTGAQPVVTVDPELAVAWEFATYKMHLVQRYGALRKLELDEHAEKSKSDNEDDAHIACKCCGAVGKWETGFRSTREWFGECHERGIKALHGTPDDWLPRDWVELNS